MLWLLLIPAALGLLAWWIWLLLDVADLTYREHFGGDDE